MAALIRADKLVLVPHSDCRYDLAVDEDGKFLRVQCKNGKFNQHGWIEFATSSNNLVQGKILKADYLGQADVFGVYCETINRVYLVPVEAVNRTRAKLWLVKPCKPCRDGRVPLLAKDYELLPEIAYRVEAFGTLVVAKPE